jgi:hypothetical protein
MAELDMFVDWVKTTLKNGAARFRTKVWLGSSFADKVCQFVNPGTRIDLCSCLSRQGRRDQDAPGF